MIEVLISKCVRLWEDRPITCLSLNVQVERNFIRRMDGNRSAIILLASTMDELTSTSNAISSYSRLGRTHRSKMAIALWADLILFS